MIFRTLTVACFAAVAISTPAAAQSWYGQLNAGANINGEVDVSASVTDGTDTLSDSGSFELDRGLFFAGSFGRDNGRVRFEAEALYTKSDFKDIELSDGTTDYDLGEVRASQAALMLNALLDLGSGGKVTPYVGGGIGYGATRIEAPELDEDEVKTGLAWQLKAGLTFAMTERATFDLGYRYLRGADFDAEYSEPGFGYAIDAEPTSHVLTAGVRFGF